MGSLGNPDPAIRKEALDHILDCVEIQKRLGSRDLSLWFADGSNYPGTQNIRHRRRWFEEGLKATHAALADGQRMLVEYKPFEPAFYHTDIADWGMALVLSQAAGPKAKVLVDTGHHYQAQNIEQIVAWLLDLNMLGGFHFNDRRYADDDLTMGSIDPYQVFRIFHEIAHFEWETGQRADIAYMIDQSHNLKGKIEAMIQTVTTAMELYAKAALVDHEKLAGYQTSCALVDAETCLKDAFSTDVRPVIREWAVSKGLARRPDGRLPPERLSGEDHRRPGPEEYVRDLELCLEEICRATHSNCASSRTPSKSTRREHKRVWPELLAKLKEVGICDYSIFRRGQDLTLVLRVDDFDKAWDELDRDPVNQRWQEFMGRLFEPVPGQAERRALRHVEGSLLPGVGVGRSAHESARVLDGFRDAIVFEFQLRFRAHSRGSRERTLRMVPVNQRHDFRKVAAGQGAVGIVETDPVFVGQHWHFERVARDHLQIERHVRVLLLQGGDHAFDIEETFAERHFGEQESLFIRLHRHIFDVAGKGVGQQIAECLGGFLAEREVVAEIEVNADPLAAQTLQPRGLLGGSPALVVLDTQADAVFAQDGLGQRDRFLAALEVLAELLEAVHLLVAAARHGGVQRDGAALFGRLHGRIERRDSGFVARVADVEDQTHVVAFHLLPEGLDGFGVRDRQARFHHAKAQPVAVLDEIEWFGAAAAGARADRKARRCAAQVGELFRWRLRRQPCRRGSRRC